MKKRVLVIDDCSFFLRVISDQLENDFDVDAVDSGEKAIALFDAAEVASQSDPYDLVITDLEMPGVNGFDVAKHIKGLNKFLPIVMLTEKEITKQEAKEYGCATYFPKSDLDRVVSMTRALFSK